MYSPTLLSEEITVDHPERIRGLIVEGANPILSYSDANAFREAREQLDLLVVIDPAMTETALLADYVLPTPCGYEKWETSGFPRSSSSVFLQLRPPIIPGPEEALPEPEIYVRLAEAMGLVREVPAELCELAPAGTTAEGAAAIFGKVQELATSRTEILFWGYRSLGAELAAPSLIAIWVTALQNAFGRRDSVVRSFGETWKDVGPFELAMEIYRRVLEHPEGVEIARTVPASEAFDACVGWEDKKIRLARRGHAARDRSCDRHTAADGPGVSHGVGKWLADPMELQHRSARPQMAKGPRSPLLFASGSGRCGASGHRGR